MMLVRDELLDLCTSRRLDMVAEPGVGAAREGGQRVRAAQGMAAQ